MLIRAIAPHAGLPDDPAIGRGPGKVTTALGIDRRHDRRDLQKGALYITRGDGARADRAPAIAHGPRIGVDYAGAWAAEPLRFWWRDHPSVSATKRAQASAGGRSVSTLRKR